jgi:hypothetical protein
MENVPTAHFWNWVLVANALFRPYAINFRNSNSRRQSCVESSAFWGGDTNTRILVGSSKRAAAQSTKTLRSTLRMALSPSLTKWSIHPRCSSHQSEDCQGSAVMVDFRKSESSDDTSGVNLFDVFDSFGDVRVRSCQTSKIWRTISYVHAKRQKYGGRFRTFMPNVKNGAKHFSIRAVLESPDEAFASPTRDESGSQRSRGFGGVAPIVDRVEGNCRKPRSGLSYFFPVWG